MRISTYEEKCPKCLKEGVTRQLGFDTDLGICCDAKTPHKYDVLPGSAPAKEQDEQPAEVLPEVPEAAQDEARLAEVLAARAQQPPSEPLVSGQVATVQSVSPEEIAAQVESGVLVPFVPMNGVMDLPGGDKLVGVRINEQFVQAIQAEAENQNLSFSDYFHQWLNQEALLSYWSPSPAVK